MERRAACPWLLALALGSAGLGCGPLTGGQTGDPGVTDYTSIDPDKRQTTPPGPGPNDICNSPRDTQAMPSDPFPGFVPIDATAGLWLDVSDGVVVDLSEPGTPRTRGVLQLGYLMHPRRLSERLLVVTVRRSPVRYAIDAQGPAIAGADELVLIDFADPDAPAVVARTTIAGDVVLTTLVQDGGDTRLYAVSYEQFKDCQEPSTRTFVRSFAVNATAIDALDMLDAGNHVAVVSARGERLIMLDEQVHLSEEPEPLLRMVALDAPGGELVATSVPAPNLPFLQSEGRVVLSDNRATFVASGGDGEVHVMRYDLSNPASLPLLSDCVLPAMGEIGGAWVLAERTFVASVPNQDGSRIFEVDAACTVDERTNLWLAGVPDTDRLVELDFSAPDAIEARLLTAAQAEPVASARAVIDPALGPFGRAFALPWASTVLEAAVSWPAEDGATETDLLAVPLDRQLADPRGATAQLFSFSGGSITARATLTPGVTLGAAVEGGVAALAAGERRLLTAFSLEPSSAARVAGEIVLNPFFRRGYVLEDGSWLRERLPLGTTPSETIGDRSEEEILNPDPSALAMLEVVDGPEDPARGAARAQIDVNPYAQLVRVGEQLVSVANDENATPGPTRLQVFDFGDPRAPKKRGMLESDALWVQDNDGELRGPGIECLDCNEPGVEGPIALVTPGAITLRGMRWSSHDDSMHAVFTFQVIDLGDPDYPRVGDTLAMPEEDRASGALASGDCIYYHYARAIEGSPDRVRFFVRRIELADPSAPELSEPINVPGALVAAQEDMLYTYELVRGDDGALQAALHRLQVRDGRAHLEATHLLEPHMPLAVSLDGDTVLIDLGPLFDTPSFVPDPPTRLLVLDAESLDVRAEAGIAGNARRLGASGDHVVYAVFPGVLVVDARQPEDATRRRYLPRVSGHPAELRVAFAGGHALISDIGDGHLFGIDLTTEGAP